MKIIFTGKNTNSKENHEAKATHDTNVAMLGTSPGKFLTVIVADKSSLHGTFMGSNVVDDSMELRGSYKRGGGVIASIKGDLNNARQNGMRALCTVA